ncbi:MAG: type II toxin-antitoxin system mRNA interferase toxin, RelE/StbE family [Candidatus Nomurabacteria bacterium]|nr:type II toxin-antitoxin system mRNA interferase toxin, RelE/StbE family [Candidatus Nomurabacteria bacterium]USN87465.1 MAG: type II toxin-antitoxin system mRNA interferase toxin, RelE/StbE family [Candidatus Nomurabacteria bacterium]
MQYILSKSFEKDFAKLPKATKKKVIVVLEKFIETPQDPSLRNHRLSGKWRGYFSIDVTGDTRAIYVIIEKNEIVRFVAIGTHSELYG